MQLSKKTFPAYQQYPEKILQFGEGVFLRGFVDWIFHQMNKKVAFNGSVVVVKPRKEGNLNTLNEQDGLYTVCLRGLENGKPENSHEVINIISRGIHPYKEFDRFLQTAENPDMRFVFSNTTEAGMRTEEQDRPFDQPPVSFPAKLTVWLFHRYTTFGGNEQKGLHILPCELIEKNGDTLKGLVLDLSRRWGYPQGFLTWLHEACTFNNTLVDRIVPGYPAEQLAEITKATGYEDKLVVEAEPFYLWVIEPKGGWQAELPFSGAGLNILYVDDLTPYHTRKVRILNGLHTMMVPVAYLYGLATVREAIEDPVLQPFIQDALFKEILPTLDMPPEELEHYAAAVIERFRNPFIRHQLLSIALNSWSKFSTRVVPTILEFKRVTGSVPQKISFSLAANIAFYKGKRGGETIPLNDDPAIVNLLQMAWQAADGSDQSLEKLAETVLQQDKCWKMNLNSIVGLHEAVTRHLTNIERFGIAKAIELIG